MPDKYDSEIERLQAIPDQDFELKAHKSWLNPDILFRFLTPDGHSRNRPDGGGCGCPTMVKNGAVAWTDELTDFVRSLDLPADGRSMTKAHLPLFAEAQRAADRMLNRE